MLLVACEAETEWKAETTKERERTGEMEGEKERGREEFSCASETKRRETRCKKSYGFIPKQRAKIVLRCPWMYSFLFVVAATP